MGFLKDKLTPTRTLPAALPAVSGKLTQKQLYQAKQNFGVNFGGVFVAEKWLFHSIFPDGAQCELDIAKENNDATREKLEKHWTSYVSDDDWNYLRDQGVTSVRVPLGYWNVNGGAFTKGTKFEKYKDVYKNSWAIFKKHYVEKAGQYGIGVLVDVHGLPGGANGGDHSGEQAGGSADFWAHSLNIDTAVEAVRWIAADLKRYDNITGLQIVNESEFSNKADKQKKYYAKAISAIRKEDAAVPVYISDGWWPNQFAEWVQENQRDGRNVGVVVDSHCYRCFGDKDKAKRAEDIVNDLHGDLLTNLTDNGAGVDFAVAEWSCVLDGETWKKLGSKDEWVRRYGATQQQLMLERATAGTWFWTYKFEAGSGGEWDFREQVGKSFSAPKVVVPDDRQLQQLLDGNYNAHVDYWNGQNGKDKYEHDRYKDGFTTAWNDCVEFAKAGARVGRRQAVKAARLQEHVAKRGKSLFLWEWEQGYDKAMEEFAKLG